MKIDSISYERRASDGSYGNRALRVTAFVEENDDADAVAIGLMVWTREHLESDIKAEEMARQAEHQRRLEEYERKQKERREALMGRDVAITVPAGEDDDISFDDDEEDDE